MSELGDRLKQERETKGLSLNQLQDMTKIQKRYLVGIEEGNYSSMPGKFYVRAFIKQYAEAVGLDPEEIFEQYQNEIPTTYNEDLPEQLSRVQSRKNMSSSTSKIFDLLPKILIGIFVIGAGVLLWYWLVLSAEDQTNEQLNEENNPVHIEEPDNVVDDEEDINDDDVVENDDNVKDEDEVESDEPKEEPEELTQELAVAESSGNTTAYDLSNTESFELKVVSIGATWVSIKNGEGKTLFEGTLQENDSQILDFTNETEASIRIGFVPSAELYVNGEKLEYAIPPNDRTTQNISIRYAKSE